MSETKFIMFSDIVEENGKTIRENNLERTHNIPLNALVEVELEEEYANGTTLTGRVQMYVVMQGRDCDGTPLYWLSKYKHNLLSDAREELLSNAIGNPRYNQSFLHILHCLQGGYPEESLQVVEP